MVCPFLEQNTHLRVLIGFSGAGRRLVAFAMCLSLSGIANYLWSEGRFVIAAGERSRCRGAAPRVVGLGLRRVAAAAGTAAAATRLRPRPTTRGAAPRHRDRSPAAMTNRPSDHK